MDPVMDYIMGWSTPALICLIAGLILMVCEMFTPGMGIPGILGHFQREPTSSSRSSLQ